MEEVIRVFNDDDYETYDDYSEFEYLESSVSEFVRIVLWTSVVVLLVIGGALALAF